jgi:beta-glucuronidase
LKTRETGIQRPVKLYTTPKTYIRDITITTAIDGADGLVDYSIITQGEDHVELRVSIQDEAGTTVARGSGSTGHLIINGVHLWQPLHAYLYTCAVEL